MWCFPHILLRIPADIFDKALLAKELSWIGTAMVAEGIVAGGRKFHALSGPLPSHSSVSALHFRALPRPSLVSVGGGGDYLDRIPMILDAV